MSQEITIKFEGGAAMSPGTMLDVSSIARNFARSAVERHKYTGKRNAALYNGNDPQRFLAYWTKAGRMVVVVQGEDR